MKKFTKIGLIFAIIALAVSCSHSPSTKAKTEEPEQIITKVTTQDGINYLGEVSKVYTSSSPARFVTGQIIDDFYGHKVRFEANLVEYFIVKPEILNYVEGLEKNNALMHQNYDNIKYDPAKKYVEFASYTDTTTEKIVCFEIRVFYGNFLETYNTELWYAKSVSFNSSFTKNMDTGEAVSFGEPLGNEDEEDDSSLNNNNTNENVDDNINQELINVFGTPAKIYSANNISSRFCTGQILEWGDKTVRFQGNLVAYSSVNPKVTAIFDKLEFNAMLNQGYYNVSYDDTKTYIEVCYMQDTDTDEIVSYELRLLDKSYFSHSYTSWYAKSCQFNDLNAFKDIKLPTTSENPVTQEIIDIIGTAAAVYTNDYSKNGEINSQGNQKKYGSLVAFSSVSQKIKDIFAEINLNACLRTGYKYFSSDSSDKFTYIEIIYNEDTEQQTINSYELRLLDNSYFDKSYTGYYAKCYEFSDLSLIQ